MSDYRRSEVVTGLFVALAAVVFALFAFKVGRFDLMGLLAGDAVTGRTFFANVKTLQVGSKVRVGGREVGEVSAIRLVEDPAPAVPGEMKRLVNEVTFELTYPDLRLDPKTARIAIAQDSLLAPHYLELFPGEWRSELPPRRLLEAELPEGLVVASEEGAGIEELMALARPAITELGTLLETVNRDVLTPENLATLSRALGELDGALAEGRQIATTLNRGLLAPDNVAAIDRTIHHLELAAADGRSVAARLDALLDAEQDPRIDAILTDVAATTAELQENLDAVSADLRTLLQSTDRVVGSVEAELSEASRQLIETLWQGEMALRKIRANPALLFFGDDETDLEARDVDLTELLRQGRARPYEQRDERDDP